MVEGGEAVLVVFFRRENNRRQEDSFAAAFAVSCDCSLVVGFAADGVCRIDFIFVAHLAQGYRYTADIDFLERRHVAGHDLDDVDTFFVKLPALLQLLADVVFVLESVDFLTSYQHAAGRTAVVFGELRTVADVVAAAELVDLEIGGSDVLRIDFVGEFGAGIAAVGTVEVQPAVIHAVDDALQLAGIS